jgi:hypothetical protein
MSEPVPVVAHPRPTPERLAAVRDLLRARIEGRYGIPVRFVNVPPPFTGDLDGAEIHIQAEEAMDAQVFTLCHLFGHTVQWALAGRPWDPGAGDDGVYSEEEIAAVGRYEREASSYGLALLHEIGVTDLDPWLADFAACDYHYLEHFYRTGEKRHPQEFWQDDQPLLQPLAIPEFKPRHLKLRWDGVVV